MRKTLYLILLIPLLLFAGCAPTEGEQPEATEPFAFRAEEPPHEALARLSGATDDVFTAHFDDYLLYLKQYQGKYLEAEAADETLVEAGLASIEVAGERTLRVDDALLLNRYGDRLDAAGNAFLTRERAFNRLLDEGMDATEMIAFLVALEEEGDLYAGRRYQLMSTTFYERIAFGLFHGSGDHRPFDAATGKLTPGYRDLYEEIVESYGDTHLGQFTADYLGILETAQDTYDQKVDEALRTFYIAGPWTDLRFSEHLFTDETRYIRYPKFESEAHVALNERVLDHYGRYSGHDPLVYNYEITHVSPRLLGFILSANYGSGAMEAIGYEHEGILWDHEEERELGLEDLFPGGDLTPLDDLLASDGFRELPAEGVDFLLVNEGIVLFLEEGEVLIGYPEVYPHLDRELIF